MRANGFRIFIGRIQSLSRSSELWLSAMIFVVAIVSRLLFRSNILHHWDSVNFALALDQYDIRLHQPHPPGTLVFYILLARGINTLLHDPNASLVWLSVVSTGLGLAILFLFSEKWFGREVSLVVVLLALTSPLIWFHGEVALSYMLEFAWVSLVVYFCFCMYSKNTAALFTSAFLIGLAGGIRPDTPVFLFPLWLFCIFMNKFPLKEIFTAFLIMVISILLWALPILAISGGLLEYLQILQSWQSQILGEASGLTNLVTNIVRFGMYLGYSLGLGLLVLIVAGLSNVRGYFKSLRQDWRAKAVAVWILPAILFYIFIHLRQPGHIFTIQPALILLTGLAIVHLARQGTRIQKWRLIGITSAVIITNAVFFLLGPTYLFGDKRMLFTTPTRSAIQDYDRYVTQRLEVIRDTFNPLETTIVASGRNYRLPDFYLSDFQIPSLSYLVNTSSMRLEEPINTIVFFDNPIPLEIPDSVVVHTLPVPGEQSIEFITWSTSVVAIVSRDRLDIEEK